ncbi:Uncharacterized protein BM_BM3853, partial [Brugia malayi]
SIFDVIIAYRCYCCFYITDYIFVFESTDTVAMIAKAIQLENAESLGFSDTVHISYWNYWLLLLLIMGIQTKLSSKSLSTWIFLFLFLELETELKIIMQDTVIVFELFLCRSMLLGFIFGSKNLLVILTSSCRNASAKDSRRFRQFLEKIKLGRIIAQF